MAFADSGVSVRVSGLGPPITVILGGTVSAGDLISDSGGTWVRADANNVLPAKLVAAQSGFSGHTIVAYAAARIHSGRISGATSGNAIYLSDTAGQYSDSAGSVEQRVGVTKSPTEILATPLFAVSNQLTVGLSVTGGDSGRGSRIDIEALVGAGLRQGALAIGLNRAVGADHTWDGNPDAGLKITVNERAANADNQGAARAIDVSARNRGANISWVNGINAGVRNDSGKIAYQLIGIQTRLENYGTLKTEAVGLDVNMSIENDTGSPLKYGIRVRNTDLSGMGAVTAALHISHTSTNGFGHLIHCATNVGDGVVANVVTPSGATVEALIIKVGSNTRYIPVYAALSM